MVNFTVPRRQPPGRGQRKKDLYRLLLARSDVSASFDACELMLKLSPELGEPLYGALFAAIVVCYARPFTDNNALGALPEKWQRHEDKRFEDAHKAMMTARHQMVAHSDVSARRALIVPPGVTAGKFADGSELKSSYLAAQVTGEYFPVRAFESLMLLERDLGRRLSEEIEPLLLNLYGAMDLPNAPFHLRFDEAL